MCRLLGYDKNKKSSPLSNEQDVVCSDGIAGTHASAPSARAPRAARARRAALFVEHTRAVVPRPPLTWRHAPLRARAVAARVHLTPRAAAGEHLAMHGAAQLEAEGAVARALEGALAAAGAVARRRVGEPIPA